MRTLAPGTACGACGSESLEWTGHELADECYRCLDCGHTAEDYSPGDDDCRPALAILALATASLLLPFAIEYFAGRR